VVDRGRHAPADECERDDEERGCEAQQQERPAHPHETQQDERARPVGVRQHAPWQRAGTEQAIPHGQHSPEHRRRHVERDDHEVEALERREPDGHEDGQRQLVGVHHPVSDHHQPRDRPVVLVHVPRIAPVRI